MLWEWAFSLDAERRLKGFYSFFWPVSFPADLSSELCERSLAYKSLFLVNEAFLLVVDAHGFDEVNLIGGYLVGWKVLK